MIQSFLLAEPFVHSVFHPSDFSVASENAFAHALAIALIRKTEFTIFHVGGSTEDWKRFPGVRETLERWGLLQQGRAQSDVFEQLEVRVKKVNMPGKNPLSVIHDYLKKEPTDLIVLSTEKRQGLPRWLRPSAAERIALKSRTMTLFVPNGVKGFVSLDSGSISLRRLLIPVRKDTVPLQALEYATRIGKILGTSDAPIELMLLHVSDSDGMLPIELPQDPCWKWERLDRSGDVAVEIALAAEEKSVDLIVMSTAGHKGFIEGLSGNLTQQVLRQSPCPLLAVPAR